MKGLRFGWRTVAVWIDLVPQAEIAATPSIVVMAKRSNSSQSVLGRLDVRLSLFGITCTSLVKCLSSIGHGFVLNHTFCCGLEDFVVPSHTFSLFCGCNAGDQSLNRASRPAVKSNQYSATWWLQRHSPQSGHGEESLGELSCFFISLMRHRHAGQASVHSESCLYGLSLRKRSSMQTALLF
jgi:hypothetical protein